MKKRRRTTKLILSSVSIILILYLTLLIPGPKSPTIPAGETDPFVWNQDEYWSYLESLFLEAKKTDSEHLGANITDKFSRIEALLDSCRSESIEPSSPILSELELEVFQLAPPVAAQPAHLPELIRLHKELRETLKDRSRSWDISSSLARDRLYRLLYGTRTAVEEVILQAESDAVPGLVWGVDEPSATPSAEIMGVTIHSGDILVSRGGAPTSALIARGSDYPGNFSHVALVHVDEKSREISIVESHIECGVAVATVDKYLHDTKLRILVLRLRSDHPALQADPMLPHKAAAAALKRALNEHIPYDFEMNSSDNRKLFCSEVASDAYSRLGVKLWVGESTISSIGIRSWLAAFGVKYFRTQEPSDLEYDPQLRVVAEWHDPETLYKDHLDNAVIDVMLEGADAGETLDYNMWMLPVARVLKVYSLLKNSLGGVGPIPEGMSAEAALKNDRFSKRHDAIKNRLIELADEFRDMQGYNPPYWELVNLARFAGKTLPD